MHNSTGDENAAFNPVKRLVKSTTHLLDEAVHGAENRAKDSYSTSSSDYHVTTVRAFLKTFTKTEYFTSVANMIDKDVLEGYINCSHFVQIEKLSKDDFKGISDLHDSLAKGSGVIDKSLLVCGILRQCGFVMPPGYFGIDFLIPFVFFKDGKFDIPCFSFVAIQSKTTKENVSQCAIKMAANLHIVRCPVHMNVNDCSDSCQAKFHGDEIREICENQICILVSAKNSTKNLAASVSICTKNVAVDYPEILDILKFNETPETPKKTSTQSLISQPERRSSPRLKLNYYIKYNDYKKIINDAFDEGDAMKKCDINSYPSSLKDVSESKKPDFIMIKVFDNDFEIQRMVWNYEIAPETDTKSKAGVSKNVKIEKNQKIKKKRVLTCIATHSIDAFTKVANLNTLAIILEIIAHETSNFQNVEPLHLPIVQNSMFNGKFCPYPSCNPMLRKYRGLNQPGNPVENYEEIFTQDAWVRSVNKCIIGPIDAKVTEYPDDYHEIVKKRMNEEDQEPEPIDMKDEAESADIYDEKAVVLAEYNYYDE